MPPHWIRLLIGPTATQILERADRAPHTLTVEDVAVVTYLMGAGFVRGSKMDAEGKLSKKQRRDLDGLGDSLFRLRDELARAGIDTDQTEAMAMGRLANPDGGSFPEREVELALVPADQRSRVLIERIVDLYQPVFRYEPRVEIAKRGGGVRVSVRGPEPELVDRVATEIYLTLGANKYKGSRDAPARILARAGNPARTQTKGPYFNPAALAALSARRQRNAASLRRRLSR